MCADHLNYLFKNLVIIHETYNYGQMISETDQHTVRVCERGLPGGKLVVHPRRVTRLLARDAGAPASNDIYTV